MSTDNKGNYLLMVSMDVAPDRESLFNEVYDLEHVPALISVPGVVSIRRYRLQALRLALGGTVREFIFENEPRYTAVYEVENPEVLTSASWADAVEAGRWAGEVRPYTGNRRHTLHAPVCTRKK